MLSPHPASHWCIHCAIPTPCESLVHPLCYPHTLRVTGAPTVLSPHPVSHWYIHCAIPHPVSHWCIHCAIPTPWCIHCAIPPPCESLVYPLCYPPPCESLVYPLCYPPPCESLVHPLCYPPPCESLVHPLCYPPTLRVTGASTVLSPHPASHWCIHCSIVPANRLTSFSCQQSTLLLHIGITCTSQTLHILAKSTRRGLHPAQ